jgi:ABC-type glycerol-3-phosphate transport system substrate-binding protein
MRSPREEKLTTISIGRANRACCAGLVAAALSVLAGPAATQTTEIKIGYMKHPIHEASISIMEKWAEKNGVKLTKVPMAYEIFMEKVTATLTSGGDQFDIIWHNDDWGQLWKKWVEPTDDIEGLKSVFKRTVDVAFLNDDGKPTVVPMAHTFGVFFYRSDLVQENEVPKTWDELVSVSQRLQKGGKVKWGYVGGMAMNHSWFAWFWALWANNCDIFAPPYERDNAMLAKAGWMPMLDQPCSQQVVEFWWDAINKYKISPPAMPSYTRNDANAIFQAGEAAFTVADLTLYGQFNDPKKSKAAGKIGISFLPLGPNRKEPVAWNDIWGWAIPKGSPPEKKAISKKMLNAMLLDTDGQIEMWKATGGPPPNISTWKTIAASDPLFRRTNEIVFNVKQVIAGAYYMPEWPAAHKAYNDGVTAAVIGKREDIPKVLKEHATKVRASVGSN